MLAAKNSDDTTHTPNDKYGIVNVNCKHDDDVMSMVNVDPNKNHEYENLSEMAKPANLKRPVSGLRGKKNKVDVARVRDEQVCLPDTLLTSDHGAKSSAPHVVTVWMMGKCDIKLVIFFMLVFCLSAGGFVLGLLSILNKENCSCSSRGTRLCNLIIQTCSLLYTQM